MSFAAPIFNPAEFELRGYTNPYFTNIQQAQVDLVESRVNGQLDWVAQLLGWNGPNYWAFPDATSKGVPYPGLPGSVDQKRQLLTGSFGFYNGYVYPELISVQNWNNTVTVKADLRIKEGQTVYLGTDTYTITTITPEGETYILDLGILPQAFYDDIASNEQLKIHDITLCPAPFYRPTVGISGDSSFVCGRDASGTVLTLYPGYDVHKTLPYIVNIFFPGSVYYFDQNVCLKYENNTRVLGSEYDAEKDRWYIQIPEVGTIDQLPPAADLVWPLYDPSTATTTEATLPVSIVSWAIRSDWNNINVVNEFTGTWGNKGGFLPYNFVFDALGLHGFEEEQSITLRQTTVEIDYPRLLNEVYYQQITVSDQAPGLPEPGDVWWNNITGTFSVWVDYAGACSAWIETDYRDPVSDERRPDLVFPTTADFLLEAATIPVNATVLITNSAGLANTDPNIQLLGLNGPLTSIGSSYLFKVRQEGLVSIWKFTKFMYDDAALFNGDALSFPYKTPVELKNANDLEPQNSTYNYIVQNLNFAPNSIGTSDVGVVLTKLYNNRTWEVSPDSILRYIGNTSIFPVGLPLQGEAWWDYSYEGATERMASLNYIDDEGRQWVQINREGYFPGISGVPPALFNANALVVYCNGVRVMPSVDYMQADFTFSYTVGEYYSFTVTPTSERTILQLPKITISDTLTGLFEKDITYLIFDSGPWKIYPNNLNSQIPLRIWKPQELQVCDTLELLNRNTYINPLVADQNLGPSGSPWPYYYIRLPFEYARNGYEWQQVALVCQDFGYFGTPLDPEMMECPPEDDLPAIYEELAASPTYTTAQAYVYTEPYWYSNAFFAENEGGMSDYENSFIGPTLDVTFDGFDEAFTKEYNPYHVRQADTTSAYGQGYGDWVGEYGSISDCSQLSGFYDTDLVDGVVTPILAPTWDSSIYKLPPTCTFPPASFDIDANNYKLGYAYFVADLSAANEPFFDIEQEINWRYPQTLPKTGYITPTSVAG